MDYTELIMKMMEHDQQNAHRIQHFLKVYEFAKLIGEGEGISKELEKTLLTAAIVHDIGIKASEEKYGDSDGVHQEELGPDLARQLLTSLNYEEKVVDRVCYLVAHHHTFFDVDGMDYQILIEADFLVNMYENHMDAPACRSVYERIFRTTTGKRICRKMYAVRD